MDFYDTSYCYDSRRGMEQGLTPQQRNVYFVGAKHFFTRRGAIRHMAKMLLIQELEKEIKSEGGIYSVHGETRDIYFKKKYGTGYSKSEYGQRSPFAYAVDAKVREIEGILSAPAERAGDVK